MSMNNPELETMLDQLAPVMLPPADYPPADLVRDTPRDELVKRIQNNADEIDMPLTDEHWEVINFLLDFYIHCCETRDPGYLGPESYWRYVDCTQEGSCLDPLDAANESTCPFGQLSSKEAVKAYRVYRILLRAFKHKGGKRHLYELFPYGPLFTIHLLAQLPRLINDVDPHMGTAY